MPVSRECAAWGIRMLLGQEPKDNETIDFHRAGYNTLEELRNSLLQTPEAEKLFFDANKNLAISDHFTIPHFLLRRPDAPDVPWQFGEPNLQHPQSQLCTADQMQGPLYQDLCRRLGQNPTDLHRKLWEYAYILAVLDAKGMIAPGKRGVGFGTGQEPLPSTFAAAGVLVVATDAPADLDSNELWAQSAQWSKGLEDIWRPALVDRDTFFTQVQFQTADMNNIPANLNDFDFCWSSCCLEHLGSIDHGMRFLRQSLNTLRPGGVAVHTTEFNLSSNTDTFERSDLVLFRKKDIERGLQQLTEEGHTIAPLNLWPGANELDERVDLPPFSLPHLKLDFHGHHITSIGLVVTKKG